MRCRLPIVVWLMLGLAAVSGACTSPSADPPPATIGVSQPTVSARVDDGVLQIGVLLPASGAGTTIGQSARAAIQVAVERANASGGINGRSVELFVRDEGPDEVTAALSVQRLIESHVDVIIGPASSNTAIAIVPTIVAAGIAVCSPIAAALALDDLPDDNLFFRTIASDSLQADAMAEVIERTGRTTAAIAYVDDAYGRPFEAVLQTSLEDRGIAVTESVGYSVDDQEFSTEARRLVNSGGGALALIGDADAGSRMLAALAEALDDDPRPIVINDALRQPFSVSLLESIDPATRDRIRGVSHRVQAFDQQLLDEMAPKAAAAGSGLFAYQAYDCANLFMLAAQQVGSTTPREIAAAVVDISSGGSVCTSFSDCAALIGQARNIDYDGLDGVLNLGSSGDLTVALFNEFGFDATGRDVSVESPVTVAR